MWILLFSEVTRFENNVSTILSSIAAAIERESRMYSYSRIGSIEGTLTKTNYSLPFFASQLLKSLPFNLPLA